MTSKKEFFEKAFGRGLGSSLDFTRNSAKVAPPFCPLARARKTTVARLLVSLHLPARPLRITRCKRQHTRKTNANAKQIVYIAFFL